MTEERTYLANLRRQLNEDLDYMSLALLARVHMPKVIDIADQAVKDRERLASELTKLRNEYADLLLDTSVDDEPREDWVPDEYLDFKSDDEQW